MVIKAKRTTGGSSNGGDPLSLSLDFIEGLSSTGIVLTPIKPTDTMVRRGASAASITPEQAKIVYFAMIALSD